MSSNIQKEYPQEIKLKKHNSTLINNAITPDSILIGTPAVEK